MKNNRLKSSKRKRAILQAKPVSMKEFLETVREIAKSNGKRFAFVSCKMDHHFSYDSKPIFEFQAYAEGRIFEGKTPQECIEKLRASFVDPPSVIQ